MRDMPAYVCTRLDVVVGIRAADCERWAAGMTVSSSTTCIATDSRMCARCSPTTGSALVLGDLHQTISASVVTHGYEQ